MGGQLGFPWRTRGSPLQEVGRAQPFGHQDEASCLARLGTPLESPRFPIWEGKGEESARWGLQVTYSLFLRNVEAGISRVLKEPD